MFWPPLTVRLDHTHHILAEGEANRWGREAVRRGAGDGALPVAVAPALACPLCGLAASDAAAVEHHFWAAHGQRCHTCGARLPSSRALTAHIMEQHDAYFAAALARGERAMVRLQCGPRARLQLPAALSSPTSSSPLTLRSTAA